MREVWVSLRQVMVTNTHQQCRMSVHTCTLTQVNSHITLNSKEFNRFRSALVSTFIC